VAVCFSFFRLIFLLLTHFLGYKLNLPTTRNDKGNSDRDDERQGEWGPNDDGCRLGPRYVFFKIFSLYLTNDRLISF
jgi:hypothetical protein